MGSNDGLAQGSILGPLLFLIYVNHISQTVKSTFLLYADDLHLLPTQRIR